MITSHYPYDMIIRYDSARKLHAFVGSVKKQKCPPPSPSLASQAREPFNEYLIAISVDRVVRLR